ncbi:MAG: hypothetical protein NVS2B16_08120 [Chloroflexota bacterium]
MKKTLITLTLLAAMAGGVLAPSLAGRASAAVHSRSHAAAFDKTRFVAHLGVAIFAVHHVYKKYQSGSFNKGAPHRARSIVANGALLLIGYHEAKLAYTIAQSSKSKTLRAVIAPLNGLVGDLNRVGSTFKRGTYNAGGVSTLNREAQTVSGASAGAGYAVKDRPTALPAGA